MTRKKKYNPYKLQESLFQGIINQFVFMQLAQKELLIFRNKKLFNKERSVLGAFGTSSLFTFLRDRPLKWTVSLGELCRDQFGVNYIKDELITFKQDSYLKVCEALEPMHLELIKGTNPKHRLAPFFVLAPEQTDIDGGWIYDVATEHGWFNEYITSMENK